MSVESYFAQRMKDLRTLQGVSQKALAEKVAEFAGLTLDPSAVTRIEKNSGGDMAILRMEKGARTIRLGEAVAIADALGVPLAEMLPPGMSGEQRQIVELPGAVLGRLREVREAADAVLRLAEATDVADEMWHENEQLRRTHDLLRDAHHIPFVDDEHQGGNCADIVLGLIAKQYRKQREFADRMSAAVSSDGGTEATPDDH